MKVVNTPILKDAYGIFSTVGAWDSRQTMMHDDTNNLLGFSLGCNDIDPDLVFFILEDVAREIIKKDQKRKME